MSLKRDLAFLYGIPLLLIGALYYTLKDRAPFWLLSDEPARAWVDPCASTILQDGEKQLVTFHQVQILLPFRVSVRAIEAGLEMSEVRSGCAYLENGAHLALLTLTPQTASAFDSLANTTCFLSTDRCWTQPVGSATLSCMKAGGIPASEVAWVPSATCICPSAHVKVLLRGQDAQFHELYDALVKGLTKADVPLEG